MAAQRISKVFTARVEDADVDGPVAWMTATYIPGPSLAEAVDSHGPLPEASLLALAAGVVDRDLKPYNVLLFEDYPRVTDLGITPVYGIHHADGIPGAPAQGPTVRRPGGRMRCGAWA